MEKINIVSAAGLYITFLFIGPHGPFGPHQASDDHSHTHKKHIVKLMRKEDIDQTLKVRKYTPLPT